MACLSDDITLLSSFPHLWGILGYLKSFACKSTLIIHNRQALYYSIVPLSEEASIAIIQPRAGNTLYGSVDLAAVVVGRI